MNQFMFLEELILKQQRYFKIPIMTQMDEILDGGIQTGIITEIYGESGTGKTHICMQLMINNILANPSNKVIYMSTSKPIQTERLLLLLKYRLGNKSKEKFNNLAQNCIIQHFNDYKIVNDYLYEHIVKQLEYHQCNLIIIDNIASYFQEQQFTQNMIQKQAAYKKLANHLKFLAQKFNIAIVVINNVAASMNQNKNVPSLGPKWTEVIDERILIERKGMRRIFKLELSHRIQQDETHFQITETGLMPIID